MNTADPTPLTSALATQDKLRDVRAHLDTMTPQLVHSADGRIMMAAASIPEGMAIEEDYPLTTPKLKLPPIGQDPAFIDQYNASLLNEIEGRFDGYGLNTMEGTDGNNLLGRCCTVAFKGEEFQVIWSGARNQWIVLPGRVTYSLEFGGEEITIDIAKTFLSGQSGWITLPISFLPETWNDLTEHPGSYGGYEIVSIEQPVLSDEKPVSDPPTLVLEQDSAFTNNLAIIHKWSQGVFQFPLAKVTAPGGRRITPLIEVCHQGVLDFSLREAWRGSFPNYTTNA